MKRIILITFLCLLSSPLYLAKAQDPDPDGSITIPIITSLPGDTGGSRAPVLVPIECYYYSSLSSVVACFQYSLGTVNVEIRDLDSGSVSSQNVSGTAGIHVIPVSSSPGSYSITFTLADGTEYVDTYIIE